MTSKKIIHTSDFDYENVIRRLKQAENRRERQPETKALQLRSDRASPRKSADAQPQPRSSFWARSTGALRDESRQLAVAALALLGFGGWLVSSAQALYTQRGDALLAGGCHENQLAHAGASYCVDDRRFVHTLNADGTTKKAAIDWRVNELSHRVAEAAAAREARQRSGAQ